MSYHELQMNYDFGPRPVFQKLQIAAGATHDEPSSFPSLLHDVACNHSAISSDKHCLWRTRHVQPSQRRSNRRCRQCQISRVLQRFDGRDQLLGNSLRCFSYRSSQLHHSGARLLIYRVIAFIGDLRWREPQAPPNESGIQQATVPPPACPQAPLGNSTTSISSSDQFSKRQDTDDDPEDCLFLKCVTIALITLSS